MFGGLGECFCDVRENGSFLFSCKSATVGVKTPDLQIYPVNEGIYKMKYNSIGTKCEGFLVFFFLLIHVFLSLCSSYDSRSQGRNGNL